MKLVDFLVNVYFVNKDLAPSTRHNYMGRARAFQAWAGGDVDTNDFSEELLNRYLFSLQERKLSSHTVRSTRTALTTFWNEAHRKGLSPEPQRLRNIKVHETSKEVWDEHDVSRLVAAAQVFRGRFRGTEIDRTLYWQSIVLAAWNSGLRQGDLHSIRCHTIGDDGTLNVLQNKTKRYVRVRFSESTMKLIREFEAQVPREFVWPLWSSSEAFFKAFRRIVSVAGLTGTFKKLRKSSATAVEKQRPNTAWKHLGHSNPQTTLTWYLNPGLWDDIPSPPEVEMN